MSLSLSLSPCLTRLSHVTAAKARERQRKLYLLCAACALVCTMFGTPIPAYAVSLDVIVDGERERECLVYLSRVKGEAARVMPEALPPDP